MSCLPGSVAAISDFGMTETGIFALFIAIFAAIWRPVISGFANVGKVTFFAPHTLRRALASLRYPLRLLEQMFQIGWNSLSVVALTAIFTGAALAQQIYTGNPGSRPSRRCPPSW